MSTIKNIDHQNMRDVLMTQCSGKAGLAEGTNANTIKTAAAVDFSINGVMYTKAITDNIAVSAGVQLDGTDCMYLITADSAGAITATKGVEAAAGSAVYLPAPPDNEAVIGAIKVATLAADFTLGTTDLGAATVTDTYYDLAYDTQAAF